MDERINDVLNFWFEDLDEDTAIKGSETAKRWFIKNEKNDKFIKKNFEKDVKKAAKDEYKDWEETPEGRLALIILLDQFSRNIYRDTPKAFENDLKALELCLKSLKDGTVERLRLIERVFLFMPLMHSENLELQELSVQSFEKLYKRAEEEEDINAEYFQSNYDYAVRHKEAIELFKRFPHRNKTLNRRSTSDEIEYLQDPNHSF